jgi:hypothetical protein
MLCQSSLLFWGFFSLVSTLAINNVPVATPISKGGPSLGVSPTPAPAVGELRRRQATQVTQETVLAAPDNTCGYFGGSSGSSPTLCSRTAAANKAEQVCHGVAHPETASSQPQQRQQTAPNPHLAVCSVVILHQAARLHQLPRRVWIMHGMSSIQAAQDHVPQIP